MIKSFSQYNKKLMAVDFCFVEVSLSPIEKLNLQHIIYNWSESDVALATDVMINHYGLKIPLIVMKEILANNLDLAVETYNKRITDVEPRDYLVDCVLEHIGLTSWPTSCENEQEFMEFVTALKEKCRQYEIEVLK